MTDYRQEDVLKHAREAFAQTIALKIQQLRKYIEKGKNSTLTGDYVEAVVRSFVRKWIGSRRLCQGTFYSDLFAASGETPMQIDGIVYSPQAGPTVLDEDDFIVVHPVYCTSVIEIKTSVSSITDFEQRLQRIYQLYFHHATKGQVMGIVISDPDPENVSYFDTNDGNRHPIFDYRNAGMCPIFVLFKENNNDYTPYEPAIDSMIRAVYRNQFGAGNYM